MLRALPPNGQSPEISLLLLASAFVAINFTALGLLRPNDALSLGASGVVWGVCTLVGHRLLVRFLPERDPLLFPLVMFLSGWGLVVIARLAPRFAERQTAWLAISVTAMLSAAILPHVLHWLRHYRYMWLSFGLLLLLSTILLGSNPSGGPTAPQLWLGLAGIYFQPSEALKIILIVFLASYLAEQYPALRAKTLRSEAGFPALSPRIVGPILLMWGLCVVVLVWQRDLGTAILFFMIFLVLLYVASGYALIVIGGLLLIALAGLVAYQQFAVVRLRVDIWLNPWPEADGRAFQIVQSLQAFAAGGVFGQGVGQGSPVYIPVVHSDFIFAAIAEEWGLLGVVVVVVCFAVLTVRGLRTALLQSGRPFRTLLAVGLSTLIGLQSLMIMGGVLRVLPLTGVTLPYLSYGGSSLLMSFILIGLLLRLGAVEH